MTDDTEQRNLFLDATPEKHLLKGRKERKPVLDAIRAGDMTKLYLALSLKQRAFCKEYLVDLNATQACIRAGYSPKYANRQGHQLMKHRGVLVYLEHLTTSREAMMTSMDPDYVLNKIKAIIEDESAKKADILRGLELVARHLGMFTDKHEISGPGGDAIRMQQEVKENAADVARTISRLSARGGADPNLIEVVPGGTSGS